MASAAVEPIAQVQSERPFAAPPTPPLNPLLHFIDPSSSNFSDDEGDIGGGFEAGSSSSAAAADGALTAKALIPEQRHSIIQERAVIRYYLDLKKDPILLQGPATEQSTIAVDPSAATATSGDDADDVVDVSLLLDVTNGCGGKIWPAAQVLGAYLTGRKADIAERWRGRTVVELGSGTGLVGFVLAKMRIGCETWITDQDAMLQLMQENLSLNPDMDPCHVAELNWGEPLIPSYKVPAKPDVLLLADCVYLEAAFQPLVDTMVLLSRSDTEILFCYMKRRKADKRFFTLLKKRFHFEDVEDDDPDRTQAYRRQGLRLYRIRLKA